MTIPVKDEDGNVIGEVVQWSTNDNGTIGLTMEIQPEYRDKFWYPRIGDISIADKPRWKKSI